jgi:Uma2 family endonuclease
VHLWQRQEIQALLRKEVASNMSAIVIGEQVRIPAWVVDLESFRRWAGSDEFPEHGWYSHLNGELWVDLSMERLYHNLIKTAFSDGLSPLSKKLRLGLYLSDRMLLTNLEALLSTEPDGMFISNESLASGLVELKEGDETLEVLGTPDMVLEVVSKTSVRKDTVVLRDLYWQAGIAEYWLVDAREETIQFDILRRSSSKYVATKKQAGWLKSNVLGKAFKLVRSEGKHGVSEYRLEIR